MNLLQSVKGRFRGKACTDREEGLEGFNAPEYFGILMERARSLYAESPCFSISLLQERFDITYRTAARVMDQLDEDGLFEDDEEDIEFVDLWEGDPV